MEGSFSPHSLTGSSEYDPRARSYAVPWRERTPASCFPGVWEPGRKTSNFYWGLSILSAGRGNCVREQGLLGREGGRRAGGGAGSG